MIYGKIQAYETNAKSISFISFIMKPISQTRKHTGKNQFAFCHGDGQ